MYCKTKLKFLQHYNTIVAEPRKTGTYLLNFTKTANNKVKFDCLLIQYILLRSKAEIRPKTKSLNAQEKIEDYNDYSVCQHLWPTLMAFSNNSSLSLNN